MKVYISVDMEAVTGINHWDEATKTHPDYQEFRHQMTVETVAACAGALDAGASDIVINDSHGTCRNILTRRLPEAVSIIRGWSGHPMGMVQELDDSFDAVLMIGYHSKGGADSNPLAHTITLRVAEIRINGMTASEFLIYGWACALVNVPVVFVSGDQALCEEANQLVDGIQTLSVSRGVGDATVSMSPMRAKQKIRADVCKALTKQPRPCVMVLPERFELEVTYVKPASAYAMSFYPGARQAGPHKLQFSTDSYFEILRLLMFAI